MLHQGPVFALIQLAAGKESERLLVWVLFGEHACVEPVRAEQKRGHQSVVRR